MFEKFKLKRKCNKMLKLWHSSTSKMQFDDYALFIITEFLLSQRARNKPASTLKRNTACATYLIVGATEINSYISDLDKNGEVLGKVLLILEHYFGFRNIKDPALSRALYLDRVQRNDGRESMIEEALLILRYDYCNYDLVEYKADTPLMLLDNEDSMLIEIEGRTTISVISDLISKSSNTFSIN